VSSSAASALAGSIRLAAARQASTWSITAAQGLLAVGKRQIPEANQTREWTHSEDTAQITSEQLETDAHRWLICIHPAAA